VGGTSGWGVLLKFKDSDSILIMINLQTVESHLSIFSMTLGK
jgi:hypothetical protein